MSEKVENKDLQQNTESFEELKNKYAMLQHENEILQAKLKWYEEQYKLSQAKRFGKSSDTIPAEQISFLNEAEIAQRPEVKEPELEKIVYERKKRKRGTNKDSLTDLPVERIEYDLPIDEQVCPVCKGMMHAMSEEVRKELKVIPAQVSIVEHVRKIYTCRTCEKAEGKQACTGGLFGMASRGRAKGGQKEQAGAGYCIQLVKLGAVDELLKGWSMRAQQ